MTTGAAVLLVLEPTAPRWDDNPLLTAQRSAAVREVEIAYVAPSAAESVAAESVDGAATCWITAEGLLDPGLPAGVPRVRLLVVGSDEPQLGEGQKRALLDAVRSILGPRGPERVPVRLALGPADELPAAVEDLRDFLVLKQIIK